MVEGSRLSVRLIRPLYVALRFAGRDADAALSRAGIDPTAISDSSNWVPLRTAMALWSAVSQEFLPQLGLRIAENIDFTQFAILEAVTDYLLVQILVRSEDLDDGLRQLERYAPISFGEIPFSFRRDSSGCLVEVAPGHADELPREFVNFVVSYLLRALLQITARPVTPAEVFLPYDLPASLDDHRRVLLGAPLRFVPGKAGFRIAADDLTVRLRGANARLSRELRARGDQVLAEMNQGGDFTNKVRKLLRTEVGANVLTAQDLAQRMGLSPRTFARRLSDEDTSYRALVDEIRKERARTLLRNTSRSLAEIAAELGFADTPSFQRAFRRWFNVAPGEFRETESQIKP